MRKIYERSELTFSLIYIAFYIILFGLADSLSLKTGVAKSITAVSGLILSFVIMFSVKKNGLCKKYGLCSLQKSKLSVADILFFLFIISANLWSGVALNFSAEETLCYIISMIFVGFIEEVIFRGFLFKALCKENIKTAVLVSSLTFGAGHIINIFSSSDLVGTLLQVGYASAIGFAFTVFFLKKGSILPCVVVHSVFNSLSAFSKDGVGWQKNVISSVLVVVPVLYAVLLLKKSDKIIDN